MRGSPLSRFCISIAVFASFACVASDDPPSTTDAATTGEHPTSSGTTGTTGSSSTSESTSDAPEPGTETDAAPASTSSSSGADTSTGGEEVPPECGDGEIDPETEECDDGPDNDDHGHCTGLCKLNVCGDGKQLYGVEECDLGGSNGDGTQCGGCSIACELGPYCGDGEHNPECGELCDQDESPDGLSCTPTCGFENAKLVFITPSAYVGNLTAYTERPVADGIEAADWICHDLAVEGGLILPPGENDEPPLEPRFRAWLSSEGQAVDQRLDKGHTGSYVTRDGDVIAVGWDGLTSGSLLLPIEDAAELGVSVTGKVVWTNTEPDGTINQPFLSCNNWTVTGDFGGGIGANSDVAQWTQLLGNDGVWTCSWKAHLYCIEQ